MIEMGSVSVNYSIIIVYAAQIFNKLY